MTQIRIPADKLTFDPVSNEYVLESPLLRLGTIYGVKTYIDSNDPNVFHAIQQYLRKMFKCSYS